METHRTTPREWVETLKVSGCAGKEQLTRKVAGAVARRKREQGQPVNAYACRFCGAHHIGSRA